MDSMLPLLLAGGAGALASNAKSLGALCQPLTRKFASSLTVESTDVQFNWLRFWLTQKVKTSHVKAVTDSGQLSILTPAPGVHWVRFKETLLTVNYGVEWHAERKNEQIKIVCFGARPDIFTDLIAEAKAIYAIPPDQKVRIFISNDWQWIESNAISARSIKSVVLPQGIGRKVLDDATRFLSARKRYLSLGIPWRRGYLVHGSPGSGKSSLALAIASDLNLPVYVLTLSANTTSTTLNRLICEVPVGSMLLVEDIDTCFGERDSTDAKRTLLFQAMLNSLDGIAASEGRILYVTTNHIERLDPALIRPGRCDLHIALGVPDAEQLTELCGLFNPGVNMSCFVAKALADKISMSEAQTRLLAEVGGVL